MSLKDTIISIILFVFAIVLSPLVVAVLLCGFFVYAIIMIGFAGIMLIYALIDWIESKARK